MVNYISVKWADFLEERAFQKMFPDSTYLALDRKLRWKYWLKNPYTISKEYLRRKGAKEVHLYGETPLRTMHQLARFAGLQKEDHFFELGSGRGRTAFFLHHYFGCKVTGIEQIDRFVKRAKEIAEEHRLSINFRCENFLQSDLEKASLIYLYGTCLSTREIHQLCKKFQVGQKILTVSYPLSDYDEKFTLLKTMKVNYPWGETEVYLNRWEKKLQ